MNLFYCSYNRIIARLQKQIMVRSQVDQNQLKLAVAAAAVEYTLSKINPESIVGIGTGSTANCFIDLLAEHKNSFQAAVASSDASDKRHCRCQS